MEVTTNVMEITKPENVGFSTERLDRIRAGMQRYIDEGKTSGVLALVARGGKIAYAEQLGLMDIAANKPMAADAIFRIYSMTKPITSAAALMLMEEGRYRLTDPVSAYIPALKGMKVVAHEDKNGMVLEDLQDEIKIRDLFTHTAGFSYGFDANSALDNLYNKEFWPNIEKPGITLKAMIEALGKLPLANQPGKLFRYSVSIDVLGYLIEAISGVSFDVFLRQRVFDPLGMVDTDFWVPPEKVARFAINYGVDEKQPGKLKDIDPLAESHYLHPAQVPSGGGGLVSTASDYLRFCQMLLNGGELDGVRLLGRKTVELMRTNHLPAGKYEDANQAYGFGLGGNVLINVNRAPAMASEGSWAWGGAANTKFWIDWKEKLIGILMLQFMPPDTYPIGPDFQNLVYQALVD